MPAETVRHPKGPPEEQPALAAGPFVQGVLESSVGAKILVAFTGLGLVTFLIFHLIGNLKLFSGPDAINAYAHFLKHGLGLLLWIARAGLLGIFVLHLFLAIRLKMRAVAARPIPYSFPGNAQAGIASRSMIWTGIVIGLFTLFHLAHYTFALGFGTDAYEPGVGYVHKNYLDLRDADGRHNVYEMMVAGFSNLPLAALYIAAQLALFVHLRHGIQSAFQTLGLKNTRFRKPIDLLGLAVALFILLGNCAIVLAVQLGWVKSELR